MARFNLGNMPDWVKSAFIDVSIRLREMVVDRASTQEGLAKLNALLWAHNDLEPLRQRLREALAARAQGEHRRENREADLLSRIVTCGLHENVILDALRGLAAIDNDEEYQDALAHIENDWLIQGGRELGERVISGLGAVFSAFGVRSDDPDVQAAAMRNARRRAARTGGA